MLGHAFDLHPLGICDLQIYIRNPVRIHKSQKKNQNRKAKFFIF